MLKFSISLARSSLKHKRLYSKFKLQYVSDVHVDVKKIMVEIEPISKYLAICGDVGNPFDPTFDAFFKKVSGSFEKIFFVGGNHDYNCRPIYNMSNYDKCDTQIRQIFEQYHNIVYLNRSSYLLNNDFLIIGTTLWSNPSDKVKFNQSELSEYKTFHNGDVEWLQKEILLNSDKKIIVLTHFLPSHQMNNPYYQIYGNMSSFFSSDLDYLIKRPLVAWICGHTHDISEREICGVYCGINALGKNIYSYPKAFYHE